MTDCTIQTRLDDALAELDRLRAENTRLRKDLRNYANAHTVGDQLGLRRQGNDWPEYRAEGKRAMNIGQAIEAMRSGQRVTRAGWNGKGMWLALQVPDANSKMQQPYVYMSPADGKLVPWLCSQSDLLANDWQICEAP